MSNTNSNCFSQLFKYFSISLVFSLVGFIFGQMFIPPQVAYMGSMFIGLFFLISLIASFFIKNRKGINITINKVYAYTFIYGICIYPIINSYAYSLGMSTVLSVFIGTICVFTGLSLYAKNHDVSNILKFGTTLRFILFGIIIASFFNMFMASNTASIAISSISIVLFTIYIVHTVETFKHSLSYSSLNSADDYAPFVLNLYTDFINLFLNILRLMALIDRD